MKKVLLIGVIMAVVFSFSACEFGESNESKSGDNKTTSTSASVTKVVTKAPEKKEPKTVTITGRDTNRYKDVTENPIVTMTMEDGNVVKMELYPKYAPSTVENFIYLINKKFYDGVIFHRVMPGFMAQGGDPDGIGTGGPGYYIEGEFLENDFAQNTLRHDIGTLSMARATPPNSAGSQFFIVTDESAYASLDNKYAAFGKVIEGMDEVYNIVNSPVNFSSNDMQNVWSKLIGGEELDETETALVQAYHAGELFDYPINPPKIKTMTVETFGVEYEEPFMIKEN